MMTSLNGSALDTPLVSDPSYTLLALSAQLKMILKEGAQQLTPFSLQPALQLRVPESGRLLLAQPPDDLFKPPAGAAESIPERRAARHRATVLAPNIRCITTTSRVRRQDFIVRRVKFATTGAKIGDHAATSVVDVDESNADFATPTTCSCDYPASARTGRQPRSLTQPDPKTPSNPGLHRPSTRAAPK